MNPKIRSTGLILIFIGFVPLIAFTEEVPVQTRGKVGESSITCDIRSVDLYEVNYFERLRHTFTLTNVGPSPTQIYDIKTSCGCTVAYMSAETIRAGESAQLIVEVDKASRPEVRTETFSIRYRVSDSKEVQNVSLKCKRVHPLRVFPKQPILVSDDGQFAFGEFLITCSATINSQMYLSRIWTDDVRLRLVCREIVRFDNDVIYRIDAAYDLNAKSVIPKSGGTIIVDTNLAWLQAYRFSFSIDGPSVKTLQE